MAVLAVLLVFAVAAFLAVQRPHLGAVLIWVFSWTYPNTLLYGTLPLNIRFDDLWIVFMFMVALFSSRDRWHRLGPAVWLAVAWMLSNTLGNVSGVLISGGAAWEGVVKDGMKATYVPLTAFILSVLLTRQRFLEKHILGLAIAGAIGGILAVAMIFHPERLEGFLIPTLEGPTALLRVMAHGTGGRRAQGAVGVMSLSGIMLNISILSMCMLLYLRKTRLRVFLLLVCGVCVYTLGRSVTRGMIGAFIAVVMLGMVFSRRRHLLMGLALVGLVGLILQKSIIRHVLARFGIGEASRFAAEGGVAGGLAIRTGIWADFLKNFSPVYAIFGVGMVTSQTWKVGGLGTTHNAYLGSFVYGGAVGLVVLILSIGLGFRLGLRLVRSRDDPLTQALGAYMLMLTAAMMMAGMFLENFQQVRHMQLYYAAMVFAENRLQQLQWQPEQMYPAEQLTVESYSQPLDAQSSG